MDLEALVQEIAAKMHCLDEHGALKKLDSMQIIDFVVELEARAKVEIPTLSLRPEVFATVETIVAMLRELNDA